MLKDVTIGQFFPGESLLHRMDPRMKIVLTVGFIVVLFLPATWVGLGAAAAFLMLTVGLSRLPLKLFFTGVKSLLILMLITAGLNVFYIKEGALLFEYGFVHVYTGGLSTAGFVAVRIVCLIVGSSILTYTTSPTALTDAIERLLSPLKLVRLNVHELAMMMTIALRFIPTLIEETDKIMSAQKARGADMDSGGLLRRMRALVPILVPLFVSAFRRAEELATAMECRCYHGGAGRTRMKTLRLAARDVLALAAVAVLCAGVVAMNYVLPHAL